MSPAGMTKSPSIWPGFPYAGLAAIYDVFVPMGYYTYHGDGYANAYRDTRDNISIIREKTGMPTDPHPRDRRRLPQVVGRGDHGLRARLARERGPRRQHVRLVDDQRARLAGAAGRALQPRGRRRRCRLPCPSRRRWGTAVSTRTHPKEVFYQTTGQNGRQRAALPPLRRAGRRGPPGRELAGRGARSPPGRSRSGAACAR